MSTYIPRFRRQDSIGLFFTSPFVTMEMVGKLLFDEMKIECSKIVGVQNISKDKVIVKFDSNETFLSIVKEYEDKIMRINDTYSVKVVNISTGLTFVSVCNAPFEMENDTIICILSRYGEIESIRNNRFSHGPFEGLLSGIRTAKMKVRENIPSSINVFGHNLTIIYNGQKRTCYKCGCEGHMAKDCATDMSEKVNIWDENDFPVMKQGNNSKIDEQKENKEPTLENTQADEHHSEMQVAENERDEGIKDLSDAQVSQESVTEFQKLVDVDEDNNAPKETLNEADETNNIHMDDDDDDLFREIESSVETMKTYVVKATVHKEGNEDAEMENKEKGERGNGSLREDLLETKHRKTNISHGIPECKKGHNTCDVRIDSDVWKASLIDSERISMKFKKDVADFGLAMEVGIDKGKHSDDDVEKNRTVKRSKIGN